LIKIIIRMALGIAITPYYKYDCLDGVKGNIKLVSNIHTLYVCRSELFTELYHRFLLSSTRADMRAMCLQAMSIVYGQHFEELGPFPDTKFLVAMLDKVSDLHKS
jgi:DnaJ family protein C protein 13